MTSPKVVDVATNARARFVVLVRDASLLEVEDTFFNTASAVLLPDVPGGPVLGGAILLPFTNAQLLAELGQSHRQFTVDMVTVPFDPDASGGGDDPQRETGLHVILAALRFLEKNPSHSLLIAGHTDRAGDDAFNLKLSDARGRSVLAVLENKRSDFVTACHTFHAPDDDPVVFAFAARTRGFDCSPANPKRATPDEIRGFQRSFNAQFGARIAVSGIVTDETRGAYFDLYQADLEKSAGGKEAMQKLRANLRFVDPARKVLGFGEKFPRENPGQDGLRSQKNRRVELLFFSPPRLPVLSAPDVGAQLFRKKLFQFTALDRDALSTKALTASQTTAAPPMQLVDAPKGVADPDDDIITSMPNAGQFDANDIWKFLRPFDELHPAEGIKPTRPNSVPKPAPSPPQPPVITSPALS